MLIACAGCDKPILDKFLLNVLERTWHADCVRCFDCQAPLTDKCFSREGKLFCRNDFFRWVIIHTHTFTQNHLLNSFYCTLVSFITLLSHDHHHHRLVPRVICSGRALFSIIRVVTEQSDFLRTTSSWNWSRRGWWTTEDENERDGCMLHANNTNE